MKLLLLADHKVGLEITSFLLDKYPEDLALVVTTSENEILENARSVGVPTRVFDSGDKLVDYLKQGKIDCDLGVLAWWPKIIKPPLLNQPRLGFINTHPSLLPYNRGKHYNFWSIVEDAPFGVSLHFVDEGVDSGDVIAQQAITYDWTDTGGTLYHKAQEAMVELFHDSYPRLRTLDIPRHPQDFAQGSFHKAVELETASRIDLEGVYRGRDFLNLLRARTFSGHPACWFEDDGERFEVRININRGIK